MIAGDTPGISACAFETPWHVASTLPKRASQIQGEKGAQRGIDLLIAAAAATALVYFALVCYRTLLVTKTSPRRALSTTAPIPECPPPYNETEFPQYKDDFPEFKGGYFLDDEREVLRGPPRKRNILSDCYRYKDRKPILRFQINKDGFYGGYVTEKPGNRSDPCFDPTRWWHCHDCRLIQAGRKGRSIMAYYPYYDVVRGHSWRPRGTLPLSLDLTCPLGSTRVRQTDDTRIWNATRDWKNFTDIRNLRALQCVYPKSCSDGTEAVVMTADKTDTITVRIGSRGQTYRTDGKGLFRIECKNLSDILTQLARQDINERINLVNFFFERRNTELSNDSATQAHQFLLRAIHSSNEKIERLFKARGDPALQSKLEGAWNQSQAQGTANEALDRLVYVLKNSTINLKNETRNLLIRIEGVRQEAEIVSFLNSTPIAEGHENRTQNIQQIANVSLAKAWEAYNSSKELVELLSKENKDGPQGQNEKRTVDICFGKRDKLILSTRGAGHMARRLIDYFRANVGRKDPDVEDAEKVLTDAETLVNDTEKVENVTALVAQVNQIMDERCIRPKPALPPPIPKFKDPPVPVPVALGLAGPVVVIVLLLILLAVVWRKTRIPPDEEIEISQPKKEEEPTSTQDASKPEAPCALEMSGMAVKGTVERTESTVSAVTTASSSYTYSDYDSWETEYEDPDPYAIYEEID